MPATWTSCRSCAGCTGTGCRTRGCGPRRRSCSGCTGSATSRAGRSRDATSSSCGAVRPRRWPRSPGTTTRTSGRSAGCLPTSSAAWRSGGALRGPARRPGRPGPRVHPGAPAARGARLSRGRRGPAGRGAGTGAAGTAAVVASRVAARETPDDAPWWSPKRPADFGGRPMRRIPPSPFGPGSAPVGAAWTAERIAVDRAHLLRRLGRDRRRCGAWSALAAGPGRTAVVAAIELAKIHEHRRHDPVGRAGRREPGSRRDRASSRLGRPEPALEADLLRRVARLRMRSLPALGPPGLTGRPTRPAIPRSG